MSGNKGKQFENKFRLDFQKTVKNSSVIRLYDNTAGYKNIKNICDYICYACPNMFLIECKSHKGASIPFSKITQYEDMKRFVNVRGVRCGIVLWLYEQDKVMYIPISTLSKLKNNNEKSVGIRHLNKYNIIEIPSDKKRVFMDSDYSKLTHLKEGE